MVSQQYLLLNLEQKAAVTVAANNYPNAWITRGVVTYRTPKHFSFRACISRAVNPTPLPSAKFIYKEENKTL